MTQRNDTRRDTVVATTTITKYRFVGRDGGQGAITDPKGVALYSAQIGDAVSVVVDGTFQCECVGAIAKNQRVKVLSDGRVQGITDGSAGFVSLSAAAADGQLVEVDLQRITA